MSKDKRKKWNRAMATIRGMAAFASTDEVAWEISGVTRAGRPGHPMWRRRLKVKDPTIKYMIRSGIARIERRLHSRAAAGYMLRRTRLVIDL